MTLPSDPEVKQPVPRGPKPRSDLGAAPKMAAMHTPAAKDRVRLRGGLAPDHGKGQGAEKVMPLPLSGWRKRRLSACSIRRGKSRAGPAA